MEKPAGTGPAPDIGAWEKHTKGIGLKLLQKFGFTGRLGAKENGVSRAIEVVVRPTNTGLGFGDITEAAKLKVNKKIEAEWRGVEYVDEEEEKKQKKSSVERLADGKGWKKNKSSSNGATKLSAAELINKYMNEDSSQKPKQQVIIDMRSKDARVITDMSEIGTDGYVDEIPADAKPKLGQELLYNINLLENAEEMNVNRDSRALARVASKIKTLTEDTAQLQRGIATEATRLARLQKIQLILTRVEEKLAAHAAATALNGDEGAETKPSEISLSSVCGVLRTVHQNFPEEFQIFGLINLLPNLISRVIVIEHWDPLEDSGLLCDWYDSLLPLSEYFDSADESQLAKAVIRAYADIVELRFVPIVRRCVASSWDAVYDTVRCVRLFEALKLVLPATMFDATVDLFLLPKLTTTVSNWRASTNVDAAAHVWLHPWLPLLETKLSSLYPELRRKYNTLLSNFPVVEESVAVVGVLLPWVGVFDQSSFENLLVRAALPRLVNTLRSVEINPSEQDIAPIEAVLTWGRLQPALPLLHLSCLWVGEFFPKWLRVLMTWLRSDGVDFGEVSVWYSGWKGLFPEVLQQDERVLQCFTLALEMMQTSLSLDGSEGAGSEHPMFALETALQRLESDNYYTLIEQHKTVLRAQRRLETLQAESDGKYGKSGVGSGGSGGLGGRGGTSSFQQVSFKEVVENFALRNGIEFVPKIGRLYEGKQLWQFGRTLCYLDQDVVFVSTATKAGKREAGGGEGAGVQASRQELYGWAPIALDDLLQLSK